MDDRIFPFKRFVIRIEITFIFKQRVAPDAKVEIVNDINGNVGDDHFDLLRSVLQFVGSVNIDAVPIRQEYVTSEQDNDHNESGNDSPSFEAMFHTRMVSENISSLPLQRLLNTNSAF
jgi:hypothetical protein